MIPSTKNQLLVSQTWTKIYQSFRNADFQSYDFDTLRRTMITYLRETYPEEFNDYIDSSEYIALIDLIAYLGQNLSFRIDLNARENFLETAQRKDSVLRLAQLISYNPKRNIPANGMLKISSIKTNEDVIDANGINLANRTVGWNDPTNTNWYQQFVSILNTAMPGSAVFGRPHDSGVVNSIKTDQYFVNNQGTDIPVFSLSKTINGTNMTFEIAGATFSGKDYIYENTPIPGGEFSYVFQNDNQGAGSTNSGFFVHFRQGTMSSTQFSITHPVANELVGVNASGINNSDVWLWQIDATGNYTTLWTKVDALVGNNVVYNNIVNNIRTVYAVSSRANDQIDLNFTDGSFGDLPKGTFRLFYRQSNGQTYTITPDQLSGVNITIPYANKAGNIYNLTLTLSLQYTVTNSSAPETIESIKQKAPQTYYLQNRMITAEDYNIGPLSVGNNVLKVTSVNRVSSGISKYFELSDVSGKYSSTDIYAHDGILYKDTTLSSFEFKFTSRNEVYAALKNTLNPIVSANSFKNFYFERTNYPRPSFTNLNLSWSLVTKKVDQSTGYFISNATIPTQTGNFSSNDAAYIIPGSLIKFQFIEKGITKTIWSKVVQVTGDGTNSGKGALNNGTGPIILTGKIPNNAIPIEIIPAFVNVFGYTLETQIVNLCVAQRNFALSFDRVSRQWFIITESNLDAFSKFDLTYQGDVSNTQKDSSWMILFQWTGIAYKVSYRLLEYIFESDKQTAFFVDYSNNNYDYTTNKIIKDQIDVLMFNPLPNPNTASQGLGSDYRWQIDSPVIETDGYIEPKKVIVGFYSANNDGQIDTPDAFTEIVNPYYADSDGTYQNFVYFEILSDRNRYRLMADQTLITPFANETAARNLTPSLTEGQLFYFYNDDAVTQYTNGGFILDTTHFAKSGRASMKFHYIHNSGQERRIDPGKSNIIDIYVLTTDYDNAFRSYLQSGSTSQPLAPTSQSLENNFAGSLDTIKSISDTLVFHPANYKTLFGSKSAINLQGTFKAVRNPARITSDNDLITRILASINSFFSVDNWEFGQSFNFTELSTYVLNQMTPDILNFIIVPKNSNIPFGSLFEIACQSNEILVSGATANDIEIIDSVTAAQINAVSPIITNTNAST